MPPVRLRRLRIWNTLRLLDFAVRLCPVLHPAFLNDTVVLVGRVTYVGRTSMEVRVDTYVEELATGIRKMINRAYVVMVAIDENGRALPVPGLILESPEQEAEWEGGKRRYELRKERHREGF